MKKCIIIIIIICILIISLIYGGYKYFSYYRYNQNIEISIEYIKEGEYDKCINLIKEENLDISNSSIFIETIIEISNKNKIIDISDYLENFDTKISQISKLESFYNSLNIENEYLDNFYNYSNKLNDYKKIVPSIKWFSSAEQYTYKKMMEGFDESNILMMARFLETYSFEKFGENEVHIKELKESFEKLSQQYYSMDTAIKTYNHSLLEESKKEATLILTDLAKIEIEIIAEQDAINNIIKKINML